MFQLCYLVFLGAFFAEFSKCLRICLEESVPTVSSVAMSVIFSSFDMMEMKIMVKIRTKYFPLIFFCCFHVEPYHVTCRMNFSSMRAFPYYLLSVAER